MLDAKRLVLSEDFLKIYQVVKLFCLFPSVSNYKMLNFPDIAQITVEAIQENREELYDDHCMLNCLNYLMS